MLTIIAPSGAVAQSAPAPAVSHPPAVTIVVTPEQPPAAIDKLVRDLQRQGQRVELKLADPKPATAAGQSAPSSGGRRPLSLAELPDALGDGLALWAERVAAMPSVVSDVTRSITAATAARGSLAGHLLVAAIMAAAIAGYALIHRLASRLSKPDAARPGLRTRLRAAALRGALEVAAIAGLYAICRGGVSLFAHPLDPAGQTVAHAAGGLAVFGLYWVAARFLLDATPAGARLLPIEEPDLQKKLFLTYAAMTALFFLSTRVVAAIATNPAAALGFLYAGGTVINAYKLWWFWRIKTHVANLVRAQYAPPDQNDLLPRLLTFLLPAALIALPLCLWIILTISAVITEGSQLAKAGAITQILAVIVPILAGGAAAVVAERSITNVDASPAVEPWRAGASAASAAGIAAAGLLALQEIWFAALEAQAPAAAAMVRALAFVGFVGLSGWVVLRCLSGYFSAHTLQSTRALPGEEDDKEHAPLSRLATAMPLLRNTAIGFVLAVVTLLALSRLGVDIAPLLAGAGIIGLAISFGSQALVRDIVSGVFFMADDAFRIGEYIDTGKLKGNVERITLRALQLRHQNGQIHTIPYGQLQAITNFSRDWTTMKFNLRLDRSSDVEKVRKLIKKVGQDMLTDPDVGPDFLLPVKMQGVTDITETALVIRIKFTAKPARPTYLQRLALRRIYATLTAEGVKFATNAVTVVGGNEGLRAGAAAGANSV